MNLFLAWNELAERPLAADRRTALARMNQWVDTLGALQLRIRPRPRLRCGRAIDNVELAVGYPVAMWRVDADQRRRLLFLQLVTASPVLPKPGEGGNYEQYGSEATHRGVRAEGLHGAWVWGGVALSLASEECWNAPNIEIEVEQLDGSGQVSRGAASVRHASAPEHVRAHVPWFEEQARQTIDGAEDLWARRAELFPHLEWCKESEGQLCGFDSGSPHFRQIVFRLFELERAFAEWAGTPIHPDFVPSKCTPETPQTLEEEEADHTATRSSGEKRVFSWHVRFTPDAGRIFFDGDAGRRVGLIGYVGLKKGGRLT